MSTVCDIPLRAKLEHGPIAQKLVNPRVISQQKITFKTIVLRAFYLTVERPHRAQIA